MAFSLDSFYKVNRRALIWLSLFGLLWLLRDFFALLFLTFVLAFVALTATRMLQRYLPLSYRVCLIGVYTAFLIGLVVFTILVVPNVIRESNKFAANVGEVQQTLLALKSNFFEAYPGWRRLFVGYLRSALDETSLKLIDGQLEVEARNLGLDTQHTNRYADRLTPEPGRDEAIRRYQSLEEEFLFNSLLAGQRALLGEYIPRLINLLYRTTVTILLALLFSFLILIDLGRLTQQIQNLRDSRLHDFYEEAAQPLAQFTYIVGRAVQVQGVIALINTGLTALGLLLLGIPSLTMLSLIVFVCSFIPVLGVFISTTPIVLVALNNGGLYLSLAAIVLVLVVHLIEAYLLNPLIYGQHLRLNPVLALIILFIGYHGFGLWGMVLGLPVTLYLLHDVFGVPLWPEGEASAKSPARWGTAPGQPPL